MIFYLLAYNDRHSEDDLNTFLVETYWPRMISIYFLFTETYEDHIDGIALEELW